MIYFSDLLEVPYKEHGRNLKEGFDCYGLVLECCKRNGTPLIDLDFKANSINIKDMESLARNGANVKPIKRAVPGCIAEIDINGKGHLGFMIDRYNIIHTTAKGVKCSYIGIFKVKAFYKVVKNESCAI